MYPTQEILRRLSALEAETGGAGATGGLVATYSADNGAVDVSVVTGPGQTPVVTMPGVVTAAGQKVKIDATTYFINGDVAKYTADMQVTVDGVVVDETKQDVVQHASNTTITRSFEVLGLAPGAHTIVLSMGVLGITAPTVPGAGSTPNGTPGARLTAEVVSV